MTGLFREAFNVGGGFDLGCQSWEECEEGSRREEHGGTEGAERWESPQEADLSVLKTAHQGPWKWRGSRRDREPGRGR